MEENLYNLLNKQYKKKPNHNYLESIDGRKFTLTNVFNFVQKFNFFLNKKKIKKQEKVFVIFENSALLTLLFFGTVCSQRIFVPINPSSGNEEIDYICRKVNPKIIISDEEYLSKIPKRFKDKAISVVDQNDFIDNIFINKSEKIKQTKGGNIAEILFSSGSTGNPKAIVLTNKNIIHNLNGINKKIKFQKNKNFLAVTPVYHNNGQFISTLIPLLTFGKTIPSNSLTSIANFWSLVEDKKIHYSSVMVTHINYLFYNKIKSKHNLKALFCGGAKLDLDIQKKFSEYFNVKILTNYGLTEVSSIATTETFENYNTGSAGSPLFNNEIYIKKKKMKNMVKY